MGSDDVELDVARQSDPEIGQHAEHVDNSLVRGARGAKIVDVHRIDRLSVCIAKEVHGGDPLVIHLLSSLVVYLTDGCKGFGVEFDLAPCIGSAKGLTEFLRRGLVGLNGAPNHGDDIGVVVNDTAGGDTFTGFLVGDNHSIGDHPRDVVLEGDVHVVHHSIYVSEVVGSRGSFSLGPSDAVFIDLFGSGVRIESDFGFFDFVPGLEAPELGIFHPRIENRGCGFVRGLDHAGLGGREVDVVRRPGHTIDGESHVDELAGLR